MVAVVSDIHINLRKYEKFEESRVRQLGELLSAKQYSTIIINGDLFDRARPSLEEIKLAQDFISSLLPATVYVLDGNHEAIDIRKRLSTFDFIHLQDCIYVKNDNVSIDGVPVYLCSWSHLSFLTNITAESKICISHLRADAGKYIKAERSMDFTKKFDLVILGDIHKMFSPFDNTHYTGSPYAVSFNSAIPSGSYIELTTSTQEWQWVTLDLPQKVKLKGNVELISKIPFNDNYLYKCEVEDTIENLRQLRAYSNVEYIKIVKQVKVEVEKPDVIDFTDLLTNAVIKTSKYKGKKAATAKKIIKGVE
jgi:DNA repair exonuclease SbcCD nuclease subunit